jgi:hypothetical protein
VAIRTVRIADPQWRTWLDQTPSPDEDGVEARHHALVSWLKRAPPATLVTPLEADRLVTEFLLLSRRLKRRQKQRVDTTGAVYAGAVVGIIGYALGGPVGGLAGPLFTWPCDL